jgi:hypothetical protein
MVQGEIVICDIQDPKVETGRGTGTYTCGHGTAIAQPKARYKNHEREPKYKRKFTSGCVRKVKE